MQLNERIKTVKRTQKTDILSWFDEHDSLTRLEAILEMGVIELPARIIELERDGWHFPRETYTAKSRRGNTYASTRYFRPVKRLQSV